MSQLPCPIVVVPDDSTPEDLLEVGQAIQEALQVPLEVNAARWRAHRESLGIPHPQEDPKGFERWIEQQYESFGIKIP